jgi:hypothetical protein
MTTRINTPWSSMPRQVRERLVWWLWLVTWAGLLAGLSDRRFYTLVVAFSAAHALLVLGLLRFRAMAFPAQLRIAYVVWVAVGTWVPHLTVLMYVATIGLAANLFLGYCPLARMLHLLPWNRDEPLSLGLVARVAFTPPVPGRFHPAPGDPASLLPAWLQPRGS